MLVITRKEDESITLHLPSGEIATITLNRISGNRAALGIEAGRHIKITRSGFVGDAKSQIGYDSCLTNRSGKSTSGRKNHVRT